MAINNPMVRPAARQIRAAAMLDGKPVPGLCGFSWTESTHYTPATFTATFATNADKAYSARWWDARDTSLTLDFWVSVGAPGEAPIRTLIGTGCVDTHTFSAGMTTVEVQGRDLASLMIDQRTSETFQNKNPFEIVEEIAGRHGLQADALVTTRLLLAEGVSQARIDALNAEAAAAVEAGLRAQAAYQASPSAENRQAVVAALARMERAKADIRGAAAPIGRYWDDHTRHTRAQSASDTTEWDLLVRIAQMQGYDLFVEGRTLHFLPAVDPNSPPWVARFRPANSVQVTPEGNIHDLRMTRRFVLAKTVTVVVKSFNSRLGKTVSASASFGATTRDVSIGGAHGTVKQHPTRYTYVRANLTQDQCQTMANRLLNDIVKHERSITFSTPGDVLLTPRVMVRLDGTGTDFDQAYYIDSITKNVSFDAGFSMDVTAKNHSPSSGDATAE